MTYHERQALASLASTVLMALVYFAYLLPHYPTGDPYSADIFRFWGSAFLFLIPVSIAVNIAIQIMLSITYAMTTKEKETRVSDERDKLIELRALRNAIYVFALGFLLAMGSLAIGMSPSVMFIVIIVSGVVTQIVGAFSLLYFYRRGF